MTIRIYTKLRGAERFLIIGFGGWPDAGEVATYTITYLTRVLETRLIGEIEPWSYYKLTEIRPMVGIKAGLIEVYDPESSRIFLTRVEGNELVLLIGVEPQVNWDRYVDDLVKLISEAGVKLVVSIGGVLDRIPHTREPLVSCVANSTKMLLSAEKAGAIPSNYTGPSSIHTYILRRLSEEKIPGVSIWGHSPYYVDPPSLVTVYSVVTILSKLLKLPIPTDSLRVERDVQLRALNDKLKADPRLAREVVKMEMDYDASRRTPPYAA